MKTFLNLLLITLTTSFATFGQTAFYKDYDWKENVAVELSEKEKKDDVVILYEKKSIEILTTEEGAEQVNLLHTKKLVNTDAGIEKSNKVYVQGGNSEDILIQKARVINPNGNIVLLNREDVQEFNDEEGNTAYLYFALEGLEKGSIIEYIQLDKSEAILTGNSLYIQSQYDKKKIDVDIILPTHLEFEIVEFNAMPKFQVDTLNKDYNRLFLSVENLIGMEDESESPYDASLQKCYYKLKRNKANGKSNFYNYTDVSKIIYGNIYGEISKKSDKELKAIIKESKSGSENLEATLRKMEYYLISNFAIDEVSYAEYMDLDYVFQNKITSKSGMVRMIAHMLKAMEVPHEIVLTADKTSFNFDQGFEGYNLLADYLIYIEELDMYWVPDLFSRLDFPPGELTGTKGLFIKERKVEDMYVAISKVKPIKYTESSKSVDIINTHVTFDETLTEPIVQLERIVSGYKASYPQFVISFMEDVVQKEVKEEFMLYLDENCTLNKLEFENDNSELAGIKPFIGRAELTGGDFTEKAGDKILLKAGKLIGPQAQLYNEKERKLPVYSPYARQYKRQIVIEIPVGYKVMNPDDATMNVHAENEKAAGFISTYTIKDNKMTIEVHEFYNEIQFSVADYKSYERVINAAADFNKLVLVFEKL